MANALKNYVRTGSMTTDLGFGPIEFTPNTGRTFCLKCDRPTSSRAHNCQNCGKPRELKKDTLRFTLNPRPSRKSTQTSKVSKITKLTPDQIKTVKAKKEAANWKTKYMEMKKRLSDFKKAARNA